MTIYQQVERTARNKRLEQLPVITVQEPNPHPSSIDTGEGSRDLHGGKHAGFSFEESPVPVIVPEYPGQGCFEFFQGIDHERGYDISRMQHVLHLFLVER